MCRPRIWTWVCENQTPSSSSLHFLHCLSFCHTDGNGKHMMLQYWAGAELQNGDLGKWAVIWPVKYLPVLFFSGRGVSCHTKLSRVKTRPFFLTLACLPFISWLGLFLPCNLRGIIKSPSLPHSSQIKSTERSDFHSELQICWASYIW